MPPASCSSSTSPRTTSPAPTCSTTASTATSPPSSSGARPEASCTGSIPWRPRATHPRGRRRGRRHPQRRRTRTRRLRRAGGAAVTHRRPERPRGQRARGDRGHGRAPRPARCRDLPRSVLVLLSTGHFAIEEAWGVEAFLASPCDRPGAADRGRSQHRAPRCAGAFRGLRGRWHDCELRVRCLLRHAAPRSHRHGPGSHGPRGGDRLDRAPAVRARHNGQLPRRHELAGRRLPFWHTAASRP